ncbi:MAG: MoaD/ThiS family protein [Planctomycetota bacterium]
MVLLRIPRVLRRYSGGAEEVVVRGATVAEALDDLFRLWPDLRLRVLDARGDVHPYLRLFRNDTELPRALDTPLADGDLVEIVAAAAGG